MSANTRVAALWLGSARIAHVPNPLFANRRQALQILSASPVLASAWAVGPLAARADDLAPARPVLFEGQTFEPVLRLFGAELRLNGVGVRQVAWFKGYLAALYMTARANTAEQVVAARGPKRIQLRMLHDVPAAEFSKAMRKGISRSAGAAQAGALDERLIQFAGQIDALGTVRKKDVVNLDLDPARGLLMSVNATIHADPVRGDDFYTALLRSFVGESPYDAQMREGLLGKNR